MNKIIYVVIFSILLIGGSTYGLQEAEAIEKIVGYVTKAKQDALKEAEAQANATAIEDYLEDLEDTSDDETNSSDDIDVVKAIKNVLGIDEEEVPKPQYTKIIGIQLSKTCLQMERNNVTSNCPTYNDLRQWDNTLPDVSGGITYDEGYWHREETAFKFKHCNWYMDKYPVIIVVDPDGCWQRYTGIRMITIQALDPSDMIFKLKLDRAFADDLRDLADDERSIFKEKDIAEREVDRLEDVVDDYEDRIRDLEDDIDKPICKKDDDRKLVLNSACKSSLQSRNYNFQLRFAYTGLADSIEDLAEAEFDFANNTSYLNATKFQRDLIKTTFGSGLMVDGISSMGIGRYVENCRNATIGADMDLLTDTLNYLLFDCEEGSTDFESIQTTKIEQTPLYIGNFTEYKYKAWLAEAKETCKEICKEY